MTMTETIEQFAAQVAMDETLLNQYQDAAFDLGRIDGRGGVFASTTKEWKAQHAEVKRIHAEILSRHVTDTGWITVPTTHTAGELVVPEDGTYAIRREDKSIAGMCYYTGGTRVNGNAIRRIDTDAPTTWIEHSTTTTRAWTAESVQACVGKRIIDQHYTRWHWKNEKAEWIADAFNRSGVTAFCLLPEPPR